MKMKDWIVLKPFRRLLSFMLVICLSVGLLPMTAEEVYADVSSSDGCYIGSYTCNGHGHSWEKKTSSSSSTCSNCSGYGYTPNSANGAKSADEQSRKLQCSCGWSTSGTSKVHYHKIFYGCSSCGGGGAVYYYSNSSFTTSNFTSVTMGNKPSSYSRGDGTITTTSTYYKCTNCGTTSSSQSGGICSSSYHNSSTNCDNCTANWVNHTSDGAAYYDNEASGHYNKCTGCGQPMNRASHSMGAEYVSGNYRYQACACGYTRNNGGIRHTVAFNANGGSGAPSSQTKEYGSVIYVSNTKPTRTGYNFVHWNSASNNTGSITVGAGGAYGYDQNGGTVTMYAIWSPKSYTMTTNHYKYNGTTGGWDLWKTTTASANYDSTYTPAYSTPNGYYNHSRSSDGWKVTGNGTFSVYYYPNAYKQSTHHYLYNYNTSAWEFWKTTTENALYDTTYVFKYTTTPTGYYNYSKNAESWKVTGEGSTNVHYHPNSYTVTFNPNSGLIDGTSYPNGVGVTAVYNSYKVIQGGTTYTRIPSWALSNRTTKRGHTLLGWYDKTSGGNQVFDASGNYKTNGSYWNSSGNWAKASGTTLYAQWKINSYNVYYNANGGTTSQGTKSVNYNSAIDLSPVASKQGYIFVGWGLSPNDTIPLSSLTMDIQNVTLYALYTVDVSDVKNHTYPNYTNINDIEEVFVEFKNSNGTTQRYPLSYQRDSARLTYNYVLNETNISSFASGSTVGYSVVAYDNAGNHRIILGDEIPLLEYYWQTVRHYKYNIKDDRWESFDVVTDRVLKGTTYTPSYVATPEGYYNYDIDGAYTVTDAKESSAYYKPNTYIVTFNPQGGEVDPTSKSVIYSDVYGDLPTPTKVGNTFQGWNKEANGNGDVVKSDSVYSEPSDSTIYAIWEPNVYRIMLLDQGATTQGTAEYFVKYGVGTYREHACTNTISKITVPTKTGYTFKGYWTEKQGKGTCYVEPNGTITSTSTSFDKDTTLYAHWEVNTYTIKYNANTGEGTMEDTLATYDKSLSLSSNTFTKTGYTFQGWAITPDGGVSYKDKQTVLNLTDVNGDVVELYAVWLVNEYDVTYDYWTNHGGSISIGTTNIVHPYGGELDLTPVAGKVEWNFLGWNVISDTTEVLDENSTWECLVCGETHSTSSMPLHDVVLYAIYNKEITLTFHDISGTTNTERQSSKTIYNRELFATIEVVEQNVMDGFDSLGWSIGTEADANIDYSSNSEVETLYDIVLYGCYSKNITLSYDTNGSAEEISSQTKVRFYNAAGNNKNPMFTTASSPDLQGYSFVCWENIDENGNTIDSYAEKTQIEVSEDLHLTAKWDKHPEIEAYDRYFTLEEAVNGEITTDRLLEKVVATDREDGTLINGSDVTIPNIGQYDFVNNAEVILTYRAIDSFGNVVEKFVVVHIVDTTISESPTIYYSRFIGADYYKDGDTYIAEDKGGLKSTSVWKNDEVYNRLLDNVLFNEKINEEYKEIGYLGLNTQIKVAGSGTWSHIEETWVFTKSDIEAVEEFTINHGLGNLKETNAVEHFFELFGACKK